MKEIRTIVCPVDFSPGSEGAAAYAIALADKLGAVVHLVHVYPLGTFVGPDGGLVLTPQMVAQLSEQSLAALRKIAAPYTDAGRKVDVHVVDGAPATEVLEVAARLGADLLVIGTHGRTGLSRMLLGSVAERIVRTSPIPVLTVRLAEPA